MSNRTYVRALRVMVCILGWIRRYDNLSKKWLKMATAVHLLTNSSEITVVLNLKKAYSSKAVPTLNVASEVEFLKSLWSTLQSHKVQEAKMADQELFISVYRCSGFALATTLGCAVLFVTVLTLDALSSVSEQAVKRAKHQPFLLLGLCGTVA